MPKGGEGGAVFYFQVKEDRAVILNRAKFAEWLRTPQRGSGKWPHLYSGKNEHLVIWDTRKEADSPVLMLSESSSPPSPFYTTCMVESGGLHSSERLITNLCKSFKQSLL